MTGLQLKCSSFSQESAVCTKQDLWREYSMLPSITDLPHTYRLPSLS